MASAAAAQVAYSPKVIPQLAEELARPATVAAPTTTNAEVMSLFALSPELNAVVVVDQDRPVGLINRNAFFDRFARPFHREIFLRRPCTVFMDSSPVLIESGASLSEVGAEVARSGEKGLNNGFLITENGRYFGHCDGLSLLRVLSDLQEEQHRQLLSSIDYAHGIQKALLAESRAALKRAFGDGHVVDWEPREVVGGDCFFALDDEDGILVGLVDCTGHGVPGALLTSIALSELNRLAADPALRRHPAALIQGLNQRVKAALQQTDTEEGEADEGMDAVFVWIPRDGRPALASSAKLPLAMIAANGDVTVIKGDRRGVGYRATAVDHAWSEHVIEREAGQRLVLATDGVCDQVGEAAGMAFGWTRFRNALTPAAQATATEMVAAGRAALLQWQGDEARRDDVTIIALPL